MANQDFIGTTDNDFTTSANWTSAVPLAGDNVTFTQSNANSLDGVDKGSVNLASLGVGPNYAGTIASAGSYLIISADSVTLANGTSCGEVYLDSGSTDEIDFITIKSQSVNYIHLKGDYGTILVRSGNVKLVSGTCDNLRIEWNGVGTPPVVINEGMALGAWSTASSVTASQTGGSFTTFKADRGTFAISGGTTGTYDIHGTANVVHTAASIPSVVEVWPGGTFDASQDLLQKTWPSVVLHQGGVADFDTGFNNHTITSKNELGDTFVNMFQAA